MTLVVVMAMFFLALLGAFLLWAWFLAWALGLCDQDLRRDPRYASSSVGSETKMEV